MIAIINSGGANLTSIIFALERFGVEGKLTTSKDEIQKASHVILPGVGAARDAMKNLIQLDLCDTLRALTKPILGICLGMQLLHEFSEEGQVDCLGVIPGRVSKIPITEGLTVPHMGWNSLNIMKASPILNGVQNNSYVYFVHSYIAQVNSATCATCNHGIDFTAACNKNNFYGVQFHPERSGDVGARILKNFLEI